MKGCLLALAASAAALTPAGIPLQLMQNANLLKKADADFKPSSHIKGYNLSVPIDHFHNETKYEPHSDEKFNLRYWLDTTHYREGGPVIALHAGEFDSDQRLPYLEHGIVPILTKALGGVGLILEHRYYGTSQPFDSLTAENYRFLTVEQALADNAYFAKNVQFPGLEHLNLTAPNTPWIIYGGSYAGSLAAFTRKVYPDVYWGGISSSGVPQAMDEYWQYMEAARYFTPKGCAEVTGDLVDILDYHLFSGNEDKIESLKELFHMGGLENDEFGMAVGVGVLGLQGTNWDPEEDQPSLAYYCGSVTSDATLYASTRHLAKKVSDFVKAAGYDDDKTATQFLNWVGWTRQNVKNDFKGPCKGKTNKECYSMRASEIQSPNLSSGWQRSWNWQTCTEYGFFMTGSGTPKDKKALLSRAVTREYVAWPCENWFNLTTPPDLDIINKYGGFNMSHSRLAWIDGKQDPWRAASPHAMGQPPRKSTISEPFILVDWGVHHWEEFGVRQGVEEEGLPPQNIVDIQQEMVHFVGEWLKEFKAEAKKSEPIEDEWVVVEL